MIRRIRLQNYMSFGAMQTAELEAITVLVGANNSGKTNFLRFVELIRSGASSFRQFWHRPPVADGSIWVEWESDFGPSNVGTASYRLMVSQIDKANGWGDLLETINTRGRQLYENKGHGNGPSSQTVIGRAQQSGARTQLRATELFNGGLHGWVDPPDEHDVEALLAPVMRARHVHLRADAMRNETTIQPTAEIHPDGSLLAALLASWVFEMPDTFLKFNAIIARCLPEMARVSVHCVNQGTVRLLFEQKDGESFDAMQVSDGVLVFAGLIAHALSAPAGGLVLIEEPERGLHPRRLVELVDLLRTLVNERQTQFVLATHSPALLNQFRDEPEAVLTFRRGPTGTIIKRLSEVPDIAESLSRADPGELLAAGAFNESVDP